MKKKRIILIVSAVLVLVLSVACVYGGIQLKKKSQLEEEKRKERSVAAITEVFHDPANEYITPDEPTSKDEVTLRIRTERYNVTRAQIQYTTDEGKTWNTADMEFEKHDDTGYYDFFKGTIPAQSESFYYRFICSNEQEENTVFVDRNLLPEKAEMGTYDTCWYVIPDFSTPDWAKGAMWYSLMPDAFFNGDTSNDVTVSDTNRVNSWNNLHLGLADKYGGDLSGVAEKTEYFKGLGVDGVYMNPIFRASQNAGYGGIDFMQVEPGFGTEETLQNMVSLLHDNDLKVMMDAVLTFTETDSIYFDKNSRFPLDGAYESESSEYSDLYAYYSWPDNYLTSWGGAVLNHSTEATQKLFYDGKDSFLQHYSLAPYSVDGWRFDCGGWLWGSSDNGNEYAKVVMNRIRECVKEANSDVLLISESDSGNLKNGVWDAEWNLSLLDVLDRYAEGMTNESGLRESLRNTVGKYPRSVALCMYNMRSQHDKNRVTNTTQVNDTASVLVQLTWLGSPSIYYGEEIGLNRERETGIGSTASFYAMEWDETEWDYEKYNLYRALGELRTNYSAVKTGAIRDLKVSSDENIYAFGRWDDKGTVITVASQNEETVQVELNARLLSVADGTVFTDWLTGKQYTVDEEGKLLVDIIPGGSVLVKGKKSSQYRGLYQTARLAKGEGTIYQTDTDAYEITGKGDIKKDKLVLALGNLYGTGSIQAVVDGEGEALLTIRDNNDTAKARAYNVSVKAGELVVTVRGKNGGDLETIYTGDYPEGKAIRIERDGSNTFCVALADVDEKGKVSNTWEAVKGSEAQVSVQNDAWAGFAPVSGTVTVSKTAIVRSGEELNYDDFEKETANVLFAFPEDKNVTRKDGKLVLNAEKGMLTQLTRGKSDDWTFKARIESDAIEGGYVGIMCAGGEDQFVAAGRAVVDGEPVIFAGRTTDGTVLIDKYVKDTQPTSAVTVQLQRIGTTYSVFYSYDDKSFYAVGADIFANYSSEEAGVFASNVKDAKFDYVCFGDSIHDGSSVNTPYADGVVDLDYATVSMAETSESMRIVSGEWEYGDGGLYQTESSGETQLGIHNKYYDDVRINVTLSLEDGTGYAGIGFGKKEYNAEQKDGFLLKYTKDHKLVLMKNGQKVADATVKEKDAETLRVVIETEGEIIRVYAGENANRVMFLENTGYESGFVCFYTQDVKARFMNYRISSMEAQWNQLSGYETVFGGANVITCAGTTSNTIDSYGATTRMGVAVTDFAATADITIGGQATAGGSAAEGGILFCASEGQSKNNNGISISVVEGGILSLKADGTEVGQYSLGADVKTARILFVRKDKQCLVYLQGQTEPVITYEDTINRGGVYQLYAVNNTTRFAELGLEDIHNTALTESMLGQLWDAGKLYVPEAAAYVEDFESQEAWTNLESLYSWHGSWAIKDGALSCVSARGYVASTVINNRIFKDFDMNFKIRFDESDSAGWAHVIFRKGTINATHSASNYAALISLDGSVQLYNGKEAVAKGKIANFKVKNWYEMRIVCNGDKIQIYDGSKLIIDYTDPGYGTTFRKEGFISFDSNQTRYSVDDVTIRPIR